MLRLFDWKIINSSLRYKYPPSPLYPEYRDWPDYQGFDSRLWCSGYCGLSRGVKRPGRDGDHCHLPWRLGLSITIRLLQLYAITEWTRDIINIYSGKKMCLRRTAPVSGTVRSFFCCFEHHSHRDTYQRMVAVQSRCRFEGGDKGRSCIKVVGSRGPASLIWLHRSVSNIIRVVI